MSILGLTKSKAGSVLIQHSESGLGGAAKADAGLLIISLEIAMWPDGFWRTSTHQGDALLVIDNLRLSAALETSPKRAGATVPNTHNDALERLGSTSSKCVFECQYEYLVYRHRFSGG
ncbi:hypothetical protein D9615_006733 [Tricholomella constricta]|uniref:Uncharacterized protein n=1 Tax=Tricholomella constricta TaxID=117010 RepID=A0A8H5H6M2_9AGAR|nr:hypothetical protein D9615_006733 [Tricholomella constricta]